MAGWERSEGGSGARAMVPLFCQDMVRFLRSWIKEVLIGIRCVFAVGSGLRSSKSLMSGVVLLIHPRAD